MNALITGANGDIGLALVDSLLLNHYKVTALDKTCNNLQKITEGNRNLEIIEMDFKQIKECQNSLKSITNAYDVFIYGAGIREIKEMINLSIEEWTNILDVNLTAAFLLTQHLIKLALDRQNPLIIIFISSISGLQGEPQRSAYCASKHGLIGLAKSLAIEYADKQIRVNVVAPGIVETDLTRPYFKDKNVMEKLSRNIPLSRWGLPHHIVQTVNFIIKNDYLTGSTLVVDGGWTAGKVL